MKITKLKNDAYPSIVGSVRDKDKPIYRWNSYKHSFSKDLVDYLIDEFELPENSWILDPYVGSGTTLLSCKERNINGLGYDISPFAVFLSKTKLIDYNKKELLKTLKSIKKTLNNTNIYDDYEFPNIPIIQKAYRKDIWNEILFVKTQILKIKNLTKRNFFLLALFSILESVSNTTKGGVSYGLLKEEYKKKV